MLPHEVGHDAGHQCLEAGVPAVFGRVQLAVPGDHPAGVAGPGFAQDDGRAPATREQAADRGHRVQQPALVGRPQPVQHPLDLAGRALVEQAVRLATGRSQPDHLPPRVDGRPGTGDQAVGSEAGEDPAQVPGVHTEPPPQPGHLGLVVLRQLENDPRLGQRVRRAQQPVAQYPDRCRIEAVEFAYLGHQRSHRCSSGRESLTESKNRPGAPAVRTDRCKKYVDCTLTPRRKRR